jgi:tRNA threonylcarbamoyladenosine biosynthesis protein TsaB
MSNFLLIETATEVCSVALAVDGRIVDRKESKEGQNHAKMAAVFVDELLSTNKIRPSQLNAVAVSKGPGSYTGLRIGVSLAKGLCFASQVPLIAVGTLEAMASHIALHQEQYGLDAGREKWYCPLMDARRMEVYYTLVDQEGQPVKEVSSEIVHEQSFQQELNGRQIVFFGNGAAKCRNIITHPHAVFVDGISASAQFMLKLTQDAYNKKQFEDVAYFEPFYLKNFVATVSAKNVLKL